MIVVENIRKTRSVKVGNIGVGSQYPISVQTMTNTKTYDIDATVNQIKNLSKVGADIIRIAIPTSKDANAVSEIVKQTKNIPLVADIHFMVKFAIKAIEGGISCIRMNPGNLPKKDTLTLLSAVKQNNIPIRIGVNAGSLSDEDRKLFIKNPADGLVQSALNEAKIFEKNNFYDFKISLKHHSPTVVVDAYKKLSKMGDWPLHVGVTEAGLYDQAVIKNTSAIAILLNAGIGNTIRVSLSDEPEKEVKVGLEILYSLGLRKRPFEIISCPTCGRTEIDLIKLAKNVEKIIIDNDIKLKVAVMGCIVNGPGEAKDADIGIAGGKGQGQIFLKGKVVETVGEDQILERFLMHAKKIS